MENRRCRAIGADGIALARDASMVTSVNAWFLVSTLPLFLSCVAGREIEEASSEVCNDQLDNDQDAQIDCNDGGCRTDAACQAPPDRVIGFSAPESIFFDTAATTWYVTNQGGEGLGDGFVSKLDAAGTILNLRFATGLDNPRGSRAVNGNLFVADVQGVTVIDLSNGQITRKISLGEVGFLNDVNVDPATGDVFVSDTKTGIIHKIVGGVTPVILLQDPQLTFPDGLLFENGTLFITSFEQGNVFAFNPAATPALRIISAGGLGKLDGIERDGQSLLVSDFDGQILRIDASGGSTVLIDGTKTFDAAADIAFDPKRRVLAIPELRGTEVSFFTLD